MQSGLSSSWVLKTDTDNVELIQFQEPDIYSYSNNQAGFSESSKGIWIYKGGSELLILCLKHQFSGLNKIVKITDSELILKNNQTEYTFLKQKVNPKPIAHLSFSYEHFQGEDENNMLDNWRYSPAMIEAIGIHKSLIYSRKT
jgi:hypothetical protein